MKKVRCKWRTYWHTRCDTLAVEVGGGDGWSGYTEVWTTKHHTWVELTCGIVTSIIIQQACRRGIRDSSQAVTIMVVIHTLDLLTWGVHRGAGVGWQLVPVVSTRYITPDHSCRNAGSHTGKHTSGNLEVPVVYLWSDGYSRSHILLVGTCLYIVSV